MRESPRTAHSRDSGWRNVEGGSDDAEALGRDAVTHAQGYYKCVHSVRIERKTNPFFCLFLNVAPALLPHVGD